MRAVAEVVDETGVPGPSRSAGWRARTPAWPRRSRARPRDGASLNVYINVASMDDADRAARYRERGGRRWRRARAQRCDERVRLRENRPSRPSHRRRPRPWQPCLPASPSSNAWRRGLRRASTRSCSAGVAPTLAHRAHGRASRRPVLRAYRRQACRSARHCRQAHDRPGRAGAPQEALEAALDRTELRLRRAWLPAVPPAALVSSTKARVCELLAARQGRRRHQRWRRWPRCSPTGGTGFPPSTAAACLEMLDHYRASRVAGKRVVVVGRSLVMRQAGVHDAAATQRQRDHLPLEDRGPGQALRVGRRRRYARRGAPARSAPSSSRPGQTVLDVGINFDTQGKLCGDVDFEAVEPVVGAITPGAGRHRVGDHQSVTMAHTVEAAERAAAHRGLLGPAACGNGR